MQCRVGMTTNPDERKAYWERQVVGFSNWQILGKYQSREKAQEAETLYARKFGCQAHPGGQESGGQWVVYKFDYTRMK